MSDITTLWNKLSMGETLQLLMPSNKDTDNLRNQLNVKRYRYRQQLKKLDMAEYDLTAGQVINITRTPREDGSYFVTIKLAEPKKPPMKFQLLNAGDTDG